MEDAGWADLLPGDEPSASDEMVLKESLDLLQKALARLPLTYRSAISLCDIEGLAYEDIARVMDINLHTPLVLANALGALGACLYIPTLMTAVYTQTGQRALWLNSRWL